MRTVPPSLLFPTLVFALAATAVGVALVQPQAALALMPALVALMLVFLFYEAPLLAVGLLIACYGLALDIQLDELSERGAGTVGTLGAAVVKVVPFAIAAMLVLRYGFAPAFNLPFLAFTLVAVISIVVLPIGRVSTKAEMVRSFIGSTAPFVIALAAAPRSFWSSLCKGVVLVPLISAVGGLLTTVVGFYSAFDNNWRFQGLHSPPFLAGFCTTAIFAATLEYLRTWRTRWLMLGAAVLVVLLASQARAPLIAVSVFLVVIFVFSGRRIFPTRRKVDLLAAGLLPALVLIGPVLMFAADRLFGLGGGDVNLSGRDVIWPIFMDAIESRPLFGYGLGAGARIIDPDDPSVRLIQSNAAHNEYLRLSVDAGIVGCALIFTSILAWVWIGTRRAPAADRFVLRAAVFAALIHSGFDNTLIASTAVIQFTWFGAALARIRMERRGAAPDAALRAAMAHRAPAR
jgi:O-antigen ligase